MEDAQRFESKVLRLEGVDCWLWIGYRTPKGYGYFNRGRQKFPATHWAYEHWVGPIPQGLQLDHLCRTRSCVNPAHLEPVTVRENVLRGVGLAAQNAARTHCLYGHPLSGENLFYRNKEGKQYRACRQCFRAQRREARKRRRQRQWRRRHPRRVLIK